MQITSLVSFCGCSGVEFLLFEGDAFIFDLVILTKQKNCLDLKKRKALMYLVAFIVGIWKYPRKQSRLYLIVIVDSSAFDLVCIHFV